jgi:uncharacterized membrane protein YfcA
VEPVAEHAVGVLRHRGLWAFEEGKDITGVVAPLGVGPVVGAVAGRCLVGIVPAAALELLIGLILIVSTVRIFRGRNGQRASMWGASFGRRW